jgi:hypothetical protein
MSLSGPQLELGIAAGPDLQERVVAAIVELEPRDRLGVAAVEILREPENGREPPHDFAPLPPQFPEIRMPARRRCPAVIAGDERNGLDLVRLETAEVAVLDQVIGVAVVSFVTDVDARIMQDGRVLEPLALLVGHPVDGPRAVEERERKSPDLVRVIGPVAAPLSQFDDAAPAHVGIPVGLRDLLAVLGDVVEDQTFAKRQIA